MPKRVRPYGSAEDAEFAGLGRSRPRTAGEDVSEPGGTMTMRDIAGQAAEAIRALRDLTSGGSAFAGLDDAREVIDYYQVLLREAAEHRLLVNFHGSTKPTGEPGASATGGGQASSGR